MTVKCVDKKNTEEIKILGGEIMLKVSLYGIYAEQNTLLRTSTQKENILIEKRRYRKKLLERKVFV